MKYFLRLVVLLCLYSITSVGQTPTPAVSSDNGDDPPPRVAALSGGPVTSPKAAASGRVYVRKDAAARIPRFETPPVIDGQLNDAVWQNAAAFGDFLQTQPGDNAPPSSPIEVLMGYDAAHLYIA